ncbi:MAG: DUF4440 domain-containing protein [Thermoguttaceae bacterium]|jgi:calcium/calmodulin-dependent protein kinase (CaM kinase) II|nr:DUF4440 domain-containing protein [Thermoguttaceae bacterium]
MSETLSGIDEPQVDDLVDLTERLIDSITEGDWETYSELCDPTLTAFEPEARGQLVEGLEFHGFYFDRGGMKGPHNTTLCSPHVRLMGDAAVVSYVRLVQRVDGEGRTLTERFEETRVWQRIDDRWKHVHFHRSANQ